MKLEEGKRKLPDGWRWVKLGEVSTVVRGSSPRPKGDPRYYGGNVPRLMVADVTRDGMYVTPKIDFLTAEGAQFSRPMKKGDVVMVVSGAPGLPAILAVDTCIHDGFVGFKNLDKNILINSFLFYFLKEIKATTDSQATGAIFRNLTTDQIKDISIAAPPLDEQRRIVEILDEKMEVVERSRQAALAQLEAAKVLPSAYLRAVFNSPEAQNWEDINLGSVSSLVIDGPHVTPTYVPKGIPFLTVRNIVNRRIDLSNVSYVSQNDHAEFCRRGKAEKGDILYTKDGTLGIPCVVDTDLEFSFFVSVALIKLIKEQAYPYFIAFALESPCVLAQVKQLGAGVGLKHMVLKSIRSLKIPIPPISEQKRIAVTLSEKMTEVEKLRKSLEEQLDTINKLPATFLRQAFNGEL